MRELELQLPDDLYARLVKAARDQDLTVEDFAEEALTQVVGLDDEVDETFYDPENSNDDDDRDWDDDDDEAAGPYDED